MRIFSIGVALLLATGAFAATLEERGDVPRDAWMGLGPESKEAFVLGMLRGIDEAADVAGEEIPNRKRFSAPDITRRIDEFYEADVENRFVPWRQACAGALREAEIRSTCLTPAEGIENAREQAGAAWLAAHPAIARRARDPQAAKSPSLPRGKGPDPCLEFHGWLLEALALGSAGIDSPLALQLANENLEVAGGIARVVQGSVKQHGDHELVDLHVEWMAADSTQCSATVVSIDGVPTRLDGIPAGTRRRFR